MDEMIERVMYICESALECEGFEICGYSAGYQNFTVKTDEGNIQLDFVKIKEGNNAD